MIPQEEPPILTVTQLTFAIKSQLESHFPSIWLQGEVSNCKLQSSGHLYFSLKDSQSQIAAVMFRGDITVMKTLPKDGSQVIVRAELNVYPPSGKYQLLVREMRLAGLGELLLKLEELKKKIHAKGWFRQEHKKKLPQFPKRIGVITSPTGAVIQDIINVLTRRFSGFSLILNPVKVQGEGAAQEIAQAIKHFNDYDLVDVMIVGRGGGSIEDLWAFNEEIVAEAIFNSRIPIISAIGHETDHTIADYVADVRAPTPSAAAEIVIAEKAQQLRHLTQIQQRLDHSLQQKIKHARQQLTQISKLPIFTSPYHLMGAWMQKLDDLRQQIDQGMERFLNQKKLLLFARQQHLHALKPSAQIEHLKKSLFHYQERLDQAWQQGLLKRKNALSAPAKWKQIDQWMDRSLQLKAERLKKISETLHAINPKNLLTRGYCILFSEKENSVITTVKALHADQHIRIAFADGEAAATINTVKK